VRLCRRWLLLIAVAATGAGADTPESLLAALKQGEHVVLLRHAQTEPGVGDPPGYKLDDCKTQRNLSAAGRAQARAFGAAFVRQQVPVGGVYSSLWCRCLETANLAFGKADGWPALNSHFDEPSSGPLQAEQVLGGIRARMIAGKNLVLVTHQVNITALTGQRPAMGEAVIARLVAATEAARAPTLAFVGNLRLP